MNAKSWTRERWQEVQTVFDQVVELPAGERSTFLARRCGVDTALREAVEQLLRADAAEASLVDGGVSGVLRGRDPLLGQRCGAFTLVEHIADGGMGSVYRGVRSEGDFEQQVAVKILRLSISTPRVRERFARERRTLARLIHPNVARLLDGGTTDNGIPFIVMELIDGVPIDRFCDERRLPVRERLRLFATVCRAVHFAHQNLVVHLDLKPTNILVDEGGTPRLLDFGVAGLLHDDGREATPTTAPRPLTPEYASPEQLRDEPVSTATDVWTLGVILFELLTGERPFASAPGQPPPPRRSDEDTEAVRPSARIARATSADAIAVRQAQAERRRTTVAGLAGQLRGDLDRIVAMALRIEPGRRYASCLQLAEDLERHLGGFPITARDPSLRYLAGRFVARNRVAVGAALAVLLALGGGFWATLHQAAIARGERDQADAARRRAEDEREHARIEATSSRLIASFLGEVLLVEPLPGERDRKDHLRAAILRRAEQVRRQHADADHLRANVLDALGRSCVDLGLFADAEPLVREALAIRIATFTEHSLEHALSLQTLGHLQYRRGDMVAAAATFARCYELHKDCPVDVHTDVAEAANNLAAAERACGQRERARELHLEALRLRRAASGDASSLVAESLNNLAAVEPDPMVARGHLEEAIGIRERVLGAGDPLTLQTRLNLAVLTLQTGRPQDAVESLRQVVTGYESLRAAGRDGLGIAQRMLGSALLLTADLDAAEATASAAVASESAMFPEGHPRVLGALDLQARILEQRQRFAESMPVRERILAQKQAAFPAGHAEIGRALCRLGAAMARTERRTEAIEHLRGALAIAGSAATATRADLADAQFCLGEALDRHGDAAAAEPLLLASLAVYEAEPSLAGRVPVARAAIHAFYLRQQRPEQAARYAPTPRRGQ